MIVITPKIVTRQVFFNYYNYPKTRSALHINYLVGHHQSAETHEVFLMVNKTEYFSSNELFID